MLLKQQVFTRSAAHVNLRSLHSLLQLLECPLRRFWACMRMVCPKIQCFPIISTFENCHRLRNIPALLDKSKYQVPMIYLLYGGGPKMGVPQVTMGFNTKSWSFLTWMIGTPQ